MTNLPQPARQARSHPPTVALALFVGTGLSAAFVGLAAVGDSERVGQGVDGGSELVGGSDSEVRPNDGNSE